MTDYPKAFIFDLDGVITDTSELHYLSWKKLAEEIGIEFDRDFNEQLKGIGRMESLERILELDPSRPPLTIEEKTKLGERKNRYYQQLIASLTKSDILPGIETLLSTIKEKGINIALGSASKNAGIVLEKLGLVRYFDYIVDASKVKKGKPDPETFTTAANHFGIPYDSCIGIEDAAAGIEALNRANMFSVGVGDEKYLHAADYIVEDTSRLDLNEIVTTYVQWKKGASNDDMENYKIRT